MANCKHQISAWKYHTWEDQYGNEYTDAELVTDTTYEDLTLYTYHCTQCKEVFWYSKPSPTMGSPPPFKKKETNG